MKKLITLLVILLVAVVATSAFIKGNKDVEEPAILVREVSVMPVNVLGANISPLPITATVRSNSQASLKAEASGEVTAVYKTVGQSVKAGEIIAEIDNASERAILAQAQAGVASAQLAVERAELASAESQNISEAGLSSASVSLEEARVGAINAYGDALISVESAIYQNLDQFFAGANTAYARYTLSGGHTDRISDQRVEIRDILAQWRRDFKKGASNENILDLLDRAKSDLEFISKFAVAVGQGVTEIESSNSLTQAEVTQMNLDLVAAKGLISSALSKVSGARATLVASQAGANIAKTQDEQTSSGSGSLALNSAQAGLASAQAGLASASSNLERKIVRSPISGEITQLPIKVGDFISAFETTAEISSKGGFEAIGYITASDLAYVKAGDRAVVEGKYSAVVTSVASSLDARTKKIEVRFGIEDENAFLVNGSSVRVELARSFVQTQNSDSGFALPLSALKVNAENVVVFTVDTESKLVEHEVELGPLLGDKVIVSRGLEPSMNIVLDARGLSAGQLVELKR